MSVVNRPGTFTPGGDRSVKRLGCGAMQLARPGVFGRPRDRDAALAVLREAVSSGVSHVEASDSYGPHSTKQPIRKALPRRAESLVSRAAALLRRDPCLRVRQLAARLDVSERHLCRNFSAMFGIGPKQFARLARIEKVLSARAQGATWADIAYATGFTDQAHMINDCTAILGVSPAELGHQLTQSRWSALYPPPERSKAHDVGAPRTTP